MSFKLNMLNKDNCFKVLLSIRPQAFHLFTILVSQFSFLEQSMIDRVCCVSGFEISDVLRISDKDYSITFGLYFSVEWFEPRLNLSRELWGSDRADTELIPGMSKCQQLWKIILFELSTSYEVCLLLSPVLEGNFDKYFMMFVCEKFYSKFSTVIAVKVCYKISAKIILKVE